MASTSEDSNLSQYLEQITHDLRAPLASILGHAEMILEIAEEDGRLPEDVLLSAKAIRHSGKRLLTLIDELKTARGQASPEG